MLMQVFGDPGPCCRSEVHPDVEPLWIVCFPQHAKCQLCYRHDLGGERVDWSCQTMVNRTIVALDVGSAEEAVRLAKKIEPHVAAFKVGLGLLHAAGPGIVAALVDTGKPVFADAKLHDIPSQVGAAARQLGRLGVRWLTAHVSGGEAMLRAAVEGLSETAGYAGVLGVTVLTSLDAADLSAIGIATTPGKLV